MASEAGALGKISRVSRARRWLGAFFRSPRIYAGATFYERPVKREIKKIEKVLK